MLGEKKHKTKAQGLVALRGNGFVLAGGPENCSLVIHIKAQWPPKRHELFYCSVL